MEHSPKILAHKEKATTDIRDWTGQVPEGSGEQRTMEENGCEIICAAPMTLAVKG